MARLSTEDEVALDIFRAVSENWSFAGPIIADAFKRNALTDEQRGAVVATVRELLIQHRRIQFALSSAGSHTNHPHVPLIVLRVLNRTFDPEEANRFFRNVDWNAVALADERIRKIDDPILRFALTHSLPDELARSFLREYGDEADALARSLNQPPPASLRANTLKITRDELVEKLAVENITALPAHSSACGVICESAARLFSTRAFQDGLFEIQDEGSQLIAELVAPARGSHIVDFCAGAGGKALALSALMAGTGSITALDTSERKLEELRRRARRAGAFNIRALYSPPDALPAEVSASKRKVARVLVDAPCGGSGALRRNPESRWRSHDAVLEELPILQESLLRRGLALCSVGGRVIYATCSLLGAENEAIIEATLEKGGCEIVPIKLIFGKERAGQLASPCGRFLKLLPHKHGTDGFFAAVLRRMP